MCEKDHLTESHFERLLENRASRNELEAAHLHLLTCRSCLAAFFTHDDARAGLHLDDVYGAGAAVGLRRELEQPVGTLSAVVKTGLEILELPAQALSFRIMNHHRHDDTRAAAELAEDLIPIFRAKGIHREAWAAGRIVLEALRREAATLTQVEELAGRLRSLPGARAVG